MVKGFNISECILILYLILQQQKCIQAIKNFTLYLIKTALGTFLIPQYITVTDKNYTEDLSFVGMRIPNVYTPSLYTATTDDDLHGSNV